MTNLKNPPYFRRRSIRSGPCFPFQDDWALDDKYAKLTVVDGDYFHNSVRFHKFTFEENLAKLEKAVNRTKWSMTPPQVNQLLIKLDS